MYKLINITLLYSITEINVKYAEIYGAGLNQSPAKRFIWY